MSELLTLTADVALKAATKDKPIKADILVYGGGIIRPNGFGGDVLIDVSGIQLPSSVPLLADHQADLGGILGTVQPSVRDGKLYAVGTVIPATDASRKVIELARGGFTFQSSIGLHVTARKFVRAGDTIEANDRTYKAPAGGLTFVTAGILKEVTVTALGADDSTYAAIAAKRGKTMTETNTNTTNADADVHERDRLEAIAEVRDKFATRFHGREHERDSMIAAAIDDTTMTATKLELELYKAEMTVTASAVPRPDSYLQSVRDSRPNLGGTLWRRTSCGASRRVGSFANAAGRQCRLGRQAIRRARRTGRCRLPRHEFGGIVQSDVADATPVRSSRA